MQIFGCYIEAILQSDEWQLRPGDTSFQDTVGVPISDISIGDDQERSQDDTVDDCNEEGRDQPEECSSLAVPKICKGRPAKKDAFHELLFFIVTNQSHHGWSADFRSLR